MCLFFFFFFFLKHPPIHRWVGRKMGWYEWLRIFRNLPLTPSQIPDTLTRRIEEKGASMPISRTNPDRYEEGPLFVALADAVVATQESVTQTFEDKGKATSFTQRFYSWRVALRHLVGKLREDESADPTELGRTEQMLMLAEAIKIQHTKHSSTVTIAPRNIEVPNEFGRFIKERKDFLVTDAHYLLDIDGD